ncbi:hypothetical protein O6A27_14935 [Escherichia coli]|nr:hypothetical protein [Escherichia coli]
MAIWVMVPKRVTPENQQRDKRCGSTLYMRKLLSAVVAVYYSTPHSKELTVANPATCR